MRARSKRRGFQDRLLSSRLLTGLGALTIWLLCKTLRLTLVNHGRADRRPRRERGMVQIFWHSRILYLAYLYRWRGQTVIVSRSRDGELISSTLRHLGIATVRGSTSRGAASALRASLEILAGGRPVSVSPDGPRGPACRVQPGCIYLAARAAKPLLPLTYAASRALRLPSWDRFLLPLPFSRVVVVYGDPISVPPDLDAAGLEKACRDVEQALNAITRQAESWSPRCAVPMDRLYSAVLWGCAAVTFPYFLVRSATTTRYRAGWRQRLGFGLPGAPPRRQARCLWFHAVSVGEVRAVLPLLRAARARYPEARLVLSTVTEAGQQVAAREATDLEALIYFPFDFVRCIRRHLAALRPQLVVLTETELWPNFLRVCRAEGIPVMLANGRLSPRSFARYRRCGWFVRRMVRRLSACAMQSPADLARIVALGAPAERCRMAGNMKFEASAAPAPARRQALRAAWGLAEATPLLLAGSTHAGEEEQLLEAFARVRRAHPAACLLLAPRHVERAAEVAALARAQGFAVRRRGEIGEAPVLLLETMGELKELYAMADLAYIGGSLVPHGGQNPLEAAAWGVAIMFGPHTFNFAAICERLRRGEAAWRVADAEELAGAWTLLLDDPPRCGAMGSRARQIIAENQGAVERHLELIAALLEGPGGSAASA